MRWWFPPIAVTIRIALDFEASSVPCVTYETEKSRIASPPSSLKSPSGKSWWGGSLGAWARAAVTGRKKAARASRDRMDILRRLCFRDVWRCGYHASSPLAQETFMRNILVTATAAFAFAFTCGSAAAAPMTKDEYKAAKKKIVAEYTVERQKCGSRY